MQNRRAVLRPSTDRELLRDAIHRTIELRSGQSCDAHAVAAAAVTTLQGVVSQLTPILGERGVEALLSRALHLSGKRFTWFAAGQSERAGAVPLAALKTRLGEQEVSATLAASHALLVAFTDLLSSLIGSPLTARLLAPAWAISPEEERP